MNMQEYATTADNDTEWVIVDSTNTIGYVTEYTRSSPDYSEPKELTCEEANQQALKERFKE